MHNHYFLAFDVGGLFIKAAVVNEQGEVDPDTISFYPSKAHSDREEILEHLTQLICLQIGKIMDKYFMIDGLGFAFPGPFDYLNGISRISGVNKFESLFGSNLRKELTERLTHQRTFMKRKSAGFEIVFENNADMFALGEWLAGEGRNYERCVYLTIGNGTGSAFLDQGILVKSRPDVPANGWVYALPFRDSIVDDYISNRGMLRIASGQKSLIGLDVDEIAALARQGQSDAAAVFREFGEWFAELLQLLQPFHPDGIIIGGEISQSYDLFAQRLHSYGEFESVDIVVSENTSYKTFLGISARLQNKR